MKKDKREMPGGCFVLVVAFVTMIVLFIVLAIWAYVTPPPPQPPRPVPMPDLVGLNFQGAKSQYAGEFNLEIDNEEWSGEFLVGTIISQRPAAGQEYIPGRAVVRVVVSMGERLVIIPDVYGLEAEEAESVLKSWFAMVEVKFEVSEDIPLGLVIRTEPESGEEVGYGSAVVYLIISGEDTESEE